MFIIEIMESNDQFNFIELSKIEMIQTNGGGEWFRWLGHNVGDWLEAISIINPSFITTH